MPTVPVQAVPAVNLTHLWAATAALAVMGAALAVLQWTVRHQVAAQPEYFNVFPQPDKLIGVAIQRQAFRDPDLLPVYGSSELTQPQINRADEFFGSHPTGFGAFLIGNPGEQSLMIATKLAAASADARGKQVVVFLSPTWFVTPELDARGFGVNFSPLHAGIFAFESSLSAPLQQALARRLLDYPDTVGQFPLLDRALRDLSDNTPASRLQLALLSPLGMLHDLTLRESDYGKLGVWWEQQQRRARTALLPAASAAFTAADWQERIREADAGYARQRAQTSYSTGPKTGWDDGRRQLFRDKAHSEVPPDENFARACQSSKEWTDLDLLLRVAQELQVRLLLICQPRNAQFSQLQGLTDRSTNLFYQRLAQAVSPYRARLETFPDEEADPHFYRDSVHPSGKAWLIYDRALDEFYHRTLPASSR